MPGSGTHPPKTSTAQEVCVFHEVLHCAISHTPRELLQISSHTLPFCSLGYYCQPCSLSAALDSQGQAILVLLNQQVCLLQALFIAPSSTLCLRPQSLSYCFRPLGSPRTVLYRTEGMITVEKTVETKPEQNQLSHLTPHTHTFLHLLAFRKIPALAPLFSAFIIEASVTPSFWQGSKIYSSQ